MTVEFAMIAVAAISGVASTVAAFIARGKVKEIHTLVNSRLTEEIAHRVMAETRVRELEAEIAKRG